MLGYSYYDGTGIHVQGYYATGDKLKYATQDAGAPDTGMVLTVRNVYDNDSQIAYDPYQILPVEVTDALGMKVSSENDYRLLSP